MASTGPLRLHFFTAAMTGEEDKESDWLCTPMPHLKINGQSMLQRGKSSWSFSSDLMCDTFIEKAAAGCVHRVVLIGGFISWIDTVRSGSLKEPCKLASRTDLGVSQYSPCWRYSRIISGAWSGAKKAWDKVKEGCLRCLHILFCHHLQSGYVRCISSLLPRCPLTGCVTKKIKNKVVIGSEISHQKIHFCFFWWVKAGWNSFPSLPFHLDRHINRAGTCTSESCMPMKAHTVFHWLYSAVIFCFLISHCPDKFSDRAKHLHSQQSHLEHIAVWSNAPLTSHIFKINPRRDTRTTRTVQIN